MLFRIKRIILDYYIIFFPILLFSVYSIYEHEIIFEINNINSIFHQIYKYLPYLLIIFCLFFNAYFHQSLIFFITFANFIIFYFSNNYYQLNYLIGTHNLFNIDDITINFYCLFLVIAIPVIYLRFNFSNEKGIFTFSGLKKFFFIILFLIISILLFGFEPIKVNFIKKLLIDLSFQKYSIVTTTFKAYNLEFSYYEITFFFSTIFFIFILSKNQKKYISIFLIASLLCILFIFNHKYPFSNIITLQQIKKKDYNNRLFLIEKKKLTKKKNIEILENYIKKHKDNFSKNELKKFKQQLLLFKEHSIYGKWISKRSLKLTKNLEIYMNLFFILNFGLLCWISIKTAYSKAYKDKLTQIYGRQALNEELSKLLGNYSIAMIDIDHFKKFNDTYGHKSGDVVLYNIAQNLEMLVSGKVFRYGGEEFTIIYKNKAEDFIKKELNYICSYIKKTKISLPVTAKTKKEKKVSVTISIGVSKKNEIDNNPLKVLHTADTFLYKAKNNGRNRVETSFENISPAIKKEKNVSKKVLPKK